MWDQTYGKFAKSNDANDRSVSNEDDGSDPSPGAEAAVAIDSRTRSRSFQSSRSKPMDDDEVESLKAPSRQQDPRVVQNQQDMMDKTAAKRQRDAAAYPVASKTVGPSSVGLVAAVSDCSLDFAESNDIDAKVSPTLLDKKPAATTSSHQVSSEDNDAKASTTRNEPNPDGTVRPGAVLVRGIDNQSTSHEEELQHRAEHDFESYGGTAQAEIGHGGGIVSAYAVDDIVHEAKVVNQKRLRITRILMASAILLVAVGVAVPVALNLGKGDGEGKNPTILQFQPLVSGLCSPRHLNVRDDTLYVAEAGVGAMTIPEDEESSEICLPSSIPNIISDGICYGTTGQVSIFTLDGSSAGAPPLTGLFSARPIQGDFDNQVYGASAIDFDENGDMFTLLGLGYVNATELARRDPELAFASILRYDGQPVASPWVKVYEKNYAGAAVLESNPFDMVMYEGATYVVDAGSDLFYTYLDAKTAGDAEPDSVIALPWIDNIPAVQPNPRGGPCNEVMPPRGPPFCGQYQDDMGNWLYSTAPVPTAVRINPKDPSRVFIAYLSGAIWNEPISGIFYMDLVDGIPQEETLKVLKGSFWAIVDFDLYENDLFVLETAPGGFEPFKGQLSRVKFDPETAKIDKQVITEDLFQPVGLLIHDDTLYLTNNTFNKGADDCKGTIVKAALK